MNGETIYLNFKNKTDANLLFSDLRMFWRWVYWLFFDCEGRRAHYKLYATRKNVLHNTHMHETWSNLAGISSIYLIKNYEFVK